MAIEMARNGGLGIIHRFMPIEDQVGQILKVKRAGVFINPNPVTV
jgi:IMP dehydrogenase